MPFRRPKITVRRLMGLVFVVALALGLGIPAVEVYRTKDHHVHTGILVKGRRVALATMGGVQAPFWPRYLRRLTGRPWRWQPVCGPSPGVEAEICEIAQPDIALRIGGQVGYRFTPEQARRQKAIEQELARAGR